MFAEAQADDDFGVKQLELVYSVNGGREKTIKLFDGAEAAAGSDRRRTRSISKSSSVKPGDFVSYYAKATDNDSGARPKTATSDIYFVQIRPFSKDYKQAQSQAAGWRRRRRQNGVGAAVASSSVRSSPRRSTSCATRRRSTADKFRENVVFLTLAQAKLREQVDELVGKMNSRLADDEAFKKIAEAAAAGVEGNEGAEAKLKGLKADGRRCRPEQRALKLLQEAEQEYETQVAHAAAAAAVAAAAARWRRTSPTCSSWSSTSWRTSTRRSSAPSSRPAISRSTSWSRS